MNYLDGHFSDQKVNKCSQNFSVFIELFHLIKDDF
jgi:hypothetical protein